MQHFDLIGTIDVDPLLEAVADWAQVFDLQTIRETTPESPHRDTQTMFLRMPCVLTLDAIFNSLEVVDYAFMQDPRLFDAVRRVDFLAHAEPARAMIVKLLPGGHIAPHIDTGEYAETTDRYHLCIATNDHCGMRISDEVVFCQSGELWWFDKHAEHEVLNAGDTPRYHLIVDCWKD